MDKNIFNLLNYFCTIDLDGYIPIRFIADI